MQRHFNVIVPLACPHCRTELLLTLDEVHEQRSISCALCGTTILLRPEDLPAPAASSPDAPAPGDFLEA
jgi:hypothetical protein